MALTAEVLELADGGSQQAKRREAEQRLCALEQQRR
jgi:hypothetical protein